MCCGKADYVWMFWICAIKEVFLIKIGFTSEVEDPYVAMASIKKPSSRLPHNGFCNNPGLALPEVKNSESQCQAYGPYMIEIFRYVRLLQSGISQTSKPGRPVYISFKKDALGLCRVYSFAIGCECDCSHRISKTQHTSLCLQYQHSYYWRPCSFVLTGMICPITPVHMLHN